MHNVEDDGNNVSKGDDIQEESNNSNSNSQTTTTTSAKHTHHQSQQRRYEADAHATRGTKGITYSVRAASIASNVGELRVVITPDDTVAATNAVSKGRIRLKVGGGGNAASAAAATDKEGSSSAIINSKILQPPQSSVDAMQCWKDDLLLNSSNNNVCEDETNSNSNSNNNNNSNDVTAAIGETVRGNMEHKMIKSMTKYRDNNNTTNIGGGQSQLSRKEKRINYISKLLGEASSSSSCDENDSSSDANKANDSNNNVQGKNDNDGWNVMPAMKIVIRFALRRPVACAIIPNRMDLGGIHFMSPSSYSSPSSSSSSDSIIQHASLSTPHVYTHPGTHGDHHGVRSWLPTLDSASPSHRASYELCIKVTSTKDEGLWGCGSGEDLGYNMSVCHPILGGGSDGGCKDEIFGPLKEKVSEEDGEEKDNVLYQRGVEEAEQVWDAVDNGISKVLGVRHARFINDFFYGDVTTTSLQDGSGSSSRGDDDDHHYLVNEETKSTAPPLDLNSSDLNTEMLHQIRHVQPTYVTSMFTSLSWLPCPTRSLGFAIGPFATLYDPEYFRLDHNDDDDDDDDSDSEMEIMDDGDETPGHYGPSSLSLEETAKKLGEGIRQLYFAPRDDRRWIHSNVTDELIFGHEQPASPVRRPELTTSQLQERKLLEKSILGSTSGVPNRALSLMRDVLALPSYRTSSYTQIWIPNAYMSGDNSGGNMAGCPEVGGCNTFLGGAILDSTLLPPPGMRLPYYDEGRSLQFLQARNALRGWVRTALPLGGDDDVGQGYLHVLIETFLMSLYERGHGAFGEGGGKGSFYYTKRYAIGSGLNSPNLDFLPLVNVEVVGEGIGVAIGEWYYPSRPF